MASLIPGRDEHPVVAIGGVGGSGTRVGSLILEALGFHLGADLNDALDNLWFTLIFKRRSILLESNERVAALFSLFAARMRGKACLSVAEREEITILAGSDRLQHQREWLADRAASFLTETVLETPKWAWKEPNTHVVIDRLLTCEPRLKYIHFERDPFYMSSSSNQNQLHNWGPVFFDLDLTYDKKTSLTFWCMIHRRIRNFIARWPDRILLVDYDRLCSSFQDEVGRLSSFLGEALSDTSLAGLREKIVESKVATSDLPDLAAYDPRDLEYIASLPSQA
jgi:hypothetical protein